MHVAKRGKYATNKHCKQDKVLYFYLQCQWCHIGASLHPRTAETYRVPATALPPVLLLNLLYAACPALLALRCQRQPEYFLSLAPLGQTNNEKKIR